MSWSGESWDAHGTSLREGKRRTGHHVLLNEVVGIVRWFSQDPRHLLRCRLSHGQLEGAGLLHLPDHRLQWLAERLPGRLGELVVVGGRLHGRNSGPRPQGVRGPLRHCRWGGHLWRQNIWVCGGHAHILCLAPHKGILFRYIV